MCSTCMSKYTPGRDSKVSDGDLLFKNNMHDKKVNLVLVNLATNVLNVHVKVHA